MEVFEYTNGPTIPPKNKDCRQPLLLDSLLTSRDKLFALLANLAFLMRFQRCNRSACQDVTTGLPHTTCFIGMGDIQREHDVCYACPAQCNIVYCGPSICA